MKKIIFVVNSLTVGGAEKHTIKITNYFLKRKYDVRLVSISSEALLLSNIEDKEKVFFLNRTSFLDIQALIKFKNFLFKERPQVVFAVELGPMFFTYIAACISGIKTKIILSLRFTDFKSLFDRLKYIIFRIIIARIDGVIFVCKLQKKQWEEKYNIKTQRSYIIYNSVDINTYNNRIYRNIDIRKELGLRVNDIVLGVNANLRPEKRHEDIIDSARLLLDEGYNIKLVFIGDGQMKKYLIKKSIDLRVRDKLIITGFVDDVAKYISAIDISVLCSESIETFSNAVLESMAMAKPVIMTDIGGAREQVINGFNGYLVPIRDPRAIYVAVKKIIDGNEIHRLGQNALKYVVENFSDDKNLLDYRKLVESV